jgi:hypothetical protein
MLPPSLARLASLPLKGKGRGWGHYDLETIHPPKQLPKTIEISLENNKAPHIQFYE